MRHASSKAGIAALNSRRLFAVSRFQLALNGVANRRLTYTDLTGK